MKTGLQDYGTTGPRNYGAADYAPRSNRQSSIVNRQSGPAFTLIELLTVIAIMGILAAIALPTINSFKPNSAGIAARQLLDAVTRARQLALSQRTTVYMVFVPPSFWTDPAAAAWNANDQAVAANLYDKQLVGYTYISLRSVGDQPNVSYPQYLAPWRSLAQGAYIPLEKFTTPRPTTSVLQVTNGLGQVLYSVFAFNTTTNLPFPAETNRPASSARPYVNLPYIAFDGTGQLVSGSGAQPECIPVSQGNVNFGRDPTTKAALAQVPGVRELPSGNTTNNYSLVCIDQLTGRARIEHQTVQ